MTALSDHPSGALEVRTHRLHFPHLDREIETRENESIFQSARRHGVRIVGACGGRGSCGSCVVRVQGDVVPMQRGLGAEVDEAADAGLNESIDPTAGDAEGNAGAARKWRRACQLSARSRSEEHTSELQSH